jgi:rhodanese-related sulfurtransferase
MMTQNTIKTISVHELKKHYDASPDLCLIDVREADERQALHIPGSMHIPKDTLASVIDAKVPDKNHVIYLHCRGGVRSLDSARCLLDLGYKSVYSLDGGIMEWADAGFPVESGLT